MNTIFPLGLISGLVLFSCTRGTPQSDGSSTAAELSGASSGDLEDRSWEAFRSRPIPWDSIDGQSPENPLVNAIRSEALQYIGEQLRKSAEKTILKEIPQETAEKILFQSILKVTGDQTQSGMSYNQGCFVPAGLIRPGEVIYSALRATIGAVEERHVRGTNLRVLVGQRWKNLLSYIRDIKNINLLFEKKYQEIEKDQGLLSSLSKAQQKSLGIEKILVSSPRVAHFFSTNNLPSQQTLYGHSHQDQVRCLLLDQVSTAVLVDTLNLTAQAYRAEIDHYPSARIFGFFSFSEGLVPQWMSDTLASKKNWDTLFLGDLSKFMKKEGVFFSKSTSFSLAEFKKIPELNRKKIRRIILGAMINNNLDMYRCLTTKGRQLMAQKIMLEIKNLFSNVEEVYLSLQASAKPVPADTVLGVTLVEAADQVGFKKLFVNSNLTASLVTQINPLKKLESVAFRDINRSHAADDREHMVDLKHLLDKTKNVLELSLSGLTIVANPSIFKEIIQKRIQRGEVVHSKLNTLRVYRCPATDNILQDLTYLSQIAPQLKNIYTQGCDSMKFPIPPGNLAEKIKIMNHEDLRDIISYAYEELMTEQYENTRISQ